ncbi:MAG: FAD/NAD(P)-binding protein [Panacagrimonas sp.]
MRRFDLLVIGAGYAGAVTLADTLRLAPRGLSVAVLEPRAELGRGIAYSTTDDEHLLNTRAKRMSLVPGDDRHFTRWAQAHAQDLGWSGAIEDDSFAPRHWFGTYVGAHLADTAKTIGAMIEHRRETADALHPASGEWIVETSGDACFRAREVVLALGNLPRRGAALPGLDSSDDRILHAWDAHRARLQDADILIIGTGLTMVDSLLSLRARGHQGVVHAISRHGLLPLAHSDAHGRAQPLLGRSLRVALRELRLGAELDKRSGRPWQWRIDANRHHAQNLWNGLPAAEKARFLRHARSHWDVHRHRIAPAIRARLDQEMASSRLKIHIGRVGAIRAERRTLRVNLDHHDGSITTLEVGTLLNSLGFELDYRRAASPLIQSLLRAGYAQPGELSLGLATDPLGRLLDASGRAWPNLYTLGTARIGQLWETTAAHEIRVQAADLAGAIVEVLLRQATGRT